MEEFVYVIRPKRENFIETMTEEENKIMGTHFQYLNELLTEEKLILAGPCLDGAMGICIFRSESWEVAQKIMENDPAVVNGVMDCELHKYRVSLMEGR
ncbi:uncharacterized protein YciI [Bacillus sp. SORGH_AS 510]|uniref:YciI family protein n=1 Tax=Bacillus sp. SORGH_AS_0510 TaxID=3041771 RepID=UPI00277E17D0|nr:YciI family protein [Bacillus sp. SORGH_AS_0510]MDQ1146172.1 uncharacterized protein YciI [Bacillus sp. SORGH_AS_0510]